MLAWAARRAWVALPLVAAACRPPTPAEELEALVAELLPRIEALSGLETDDPVRVEPRSREALRDYVIERLNEQMPPERLRGMTAAYRAFGLIPDTVDLFQLFQALYTEQVLGYYDPGSGMLYVVEGVPRDAVEPVVAHELVHALQDRYADLDSLIAPERGNDRQLAAAAAIEGHATVVMFAMVAEQTAGGPVDIRALPDLGEELRPGMQADYDRYPVFASSPRIVRETLLFPYAEGAAFVQALWRAMPGRPAPFGPLLPLSSQQVLDPENRFVLRRDDPIELSFQCEPLGAGGGAADSAPAGATGIGGGAGASISAAADTASAGGWSVVYENTLGQFEISILLDEHLGDASGAGLEQWAGDRYRAYTSPAGGVAVVWYSIWRTSDAADAFGEAYRRVLARRPARSGIVERLGVGGHAAVLVVDAPAGADPAALPRPEVCTTGVEALAWAP